MSMPGTPPREQKKAPAYNELPNLKRGRIAPGARENANLQATKTLWMEGNGQQAPKMTLPKTGYVAPSSSLPAGVFNRSYTIPAGF